MTIGGGITGFMQRNFGLVFGGIWLVVGIPLLIAGIMMWRQESRFAQGAVSVEGQVLTRTIRHARSSGSDRGSTQYRVSYRFQAGDGPLHEGSSEVDVHLWEALREQGPVQVQYLPDEPATNRVAGSADYAGAAVMAGVGGLFSVAGGTIFLFSLIKRISRNRILESGMPAEAEVISVGPTNMSINRVRQWRITYHYHDLYGRVQQGRSDYLMPHEADSWNTGDTGRVMYDRERPEKSIWLGKR